MSLAHQNVDISWLRVAEDDHSTESFRGIYSGGRFAKFGKLLFQMNTTLSVKKDYCPNHGDGCSCGNENKINLICGAKGAKCPLEAKCSSKL